MVYPFSDHINANFGESRSDGESSRRTITVPQIARVSRKGWGSGMGRKRKTVRRPASGAEDSKGKRPSSLFNVSLVTSFAPVEHSKSLTSSLGRYDDSGSFSWLPIAGSDRPVPGHHTSSCSCIFKKNDVTFSLAQCRVLQK